MIAMPITLTCACGQRRTVAKPRLGQTLTCPACGKTLTVPAMGVPATANGKPAAKPVDEPSSRRLGFLLITAGMLLLVGAGVAGLIWSMTQPKEPPRELAQQSPVDTPAPTHRDPPPPQSKTTEPEKKDSPRLIEPSPLKRKEPFVEPVQPIEPVAQVGELPNPFTLPIKPEPPKVVEKQPNLIEPLKLVWKLKADDTFFQELVVTQKPTFKIQGIVVASLLQYRIVSRFTVKKVNDDGSRIVEQKIESAKLLLADDLTKSAIAGAVAQLPGTVYTLHLSPKMDVTKLEGKAARPMVAHLAGGMGMQMTSLIDRDGWKELAQATFFQFDQPLKVKDRWSKSMTHNWGSLGSWSGRINYSYVGKQENLHRVAYGLQLKYQPPAAGAVGLMKINNANFQPQQAEGVLLFDAGRGKVVGAEERFRVRGFLNANLLGQNTQIEIDEDQHFQIRIHEKLIP